ncbi:MAG: efflux RND transporter permease subunit [bacterium]
MREKFLRNLAHWHTTYPWRMLAVVVVLTIILALFAGQLSITMQMRDLLPQGDPKVDELNEIIDEFSTATNAMVVVQGPEDRIKEFADHLAPRIVELRDTSKNSELEREIMRIQSEIEKLRNREDKESTIKDLYSQITGLRKRINKPLFQRVDYKAETGFLKKHALMLVEEDDLNNIKDMYTDPNLTGLITNINNSLEKEYVGKEESISTREKEDGAVQFLDGIQNLAEGLKAAASGTEQTQENILKIADKLLLGDPYFISYDKTCLILNVIPTFTIMDRDLIIVGKERLQSLVDSMLKEYPQVKAGLSGDIAREYDEQVHSQQTLGFTTIIALVAIFILLVISFRMVIAPLLALVNLVVGLLWAMGAAFLIVGQLNMVTAMLSVVLLGLGIDFSIHLISGFTEWRAAGDSIAHALEKTFIKHGKGVITGALTTACAFLALLISRSQGMKEMGIVTGVGLLSVLLATFFFLPVMLVFRERLINKRKQPRKEKRDISFRSLGRISGWMSRHYGFTILTAVLVSAVLIWFALQIKYDQNYMRMEPKGLTSIALTDTVKEKFDLSMQYALCLTDNIEESRQLSEEYEELSTVARTDDISLYVPSPEQQKKRIPHLREIKSSIRNKTTQAGFPPQALPNFIKEIDRLRMNIMEMQDMAFIGGQDKVDNKCKELVGEPLDDASRGVIQDLLKVLNSPAASVTDGLLHFQSNFAPYFKKLITSMSSSDLISLDDIPVSILDRYSNRDRDKFLITIYPSGQLFTDAKVLNRFVDDLERISEKTTGMPVVAISWIRIAGKDGSNAILLTLAIVFILLWIDFGKPWYALMGMIPLGLGVFWMVGLMNITGLMLSFMTLMGLPLIIGIGIDDGVHIMHRWQHEGKGKIMTVFSSTGKAILLTSLTTMLAFGSMTFSAFPGWAWFGESLFLGVGSCFLTTVVVLPGIIGWIERKK